MAGNIFRFSSRKNGQYTVARRRKGLKFIKNDKYFMQIPLKMNKNSAGVIKEKTYLL